MAKIKSERNAPDLIINVEENQEWTDEELEILKNSFFESFKKQNIRIN